MLQSTIKRTDYGDEIRFKMEKNKLMVLYKAVCNDYILITELAEKHILSRHEISVLNEGSEELGLRLIFKPTLIKI